MLGNKRFEPKLFYSVQLEKLVPQEHELRQVAAKVDFSFVRGLVRDKYSWTGQPSVDPEVIIKLLFLGYYYGILSERELVKKTQTDLAYRWFLGYDLDEEIPTHSVLSKARSRYGVEVFQKIFDQIVEQCIEAGLVGGEQAFMDATLIEANASTSSLVPRLKVLKASEYAQEVMKGEKETDPNPPKPPQKPKFNENKVSKTDPDASMQARKSKKKGLYYEGHFLIDGKSRVITGVETTDTRDAADKQAFPLLMQARFRHRLRFNSFCADSEYSTQTLYHALFSEGLTPFIAIPDSRSPKGLFKKKDFQYDQQEDVYRCPAGNNLVRGGYEKKKKSYNYKQAVRGTCSKCTLRNKCTRGKGDRKINRLLYQEACDKAHEIAKTSKYRVQSKLRKIKTEPLFGEAKELHGLRRALFRGLERVKIQVLCIASVLNIKRIVRNNRRLNRAYALASVSSKASTTGFLRETIRSLTFILSCQRTLIFNRVF